MALVKSERIRVLSVLGFIIVLLVVYSVRIAVYGLSGNWAAVVAVLLALALVEFAVYRAVEGASRAKVVVPRSIWITSVFVELCVPSLCIAFLANPAIPIAYRALATPWILIFFPLITLSTLHLNRFVSWCAGFTAATLYLAAAYYHGWRPALVDPSHYTAVQTAVTFYALILLGSGFVAGAVASEIRNYLEAALSELEVREQLKQVQHDLEIARSIQRSLLPQVHPRLQGYEIAGWNHSADATGGDFFDWQRHSGGRLVITLADVTGHGIGPALLAAVCRAYSRACFTGRKTLSATLKEINQLLAADLMPPHFATFAAAVFNDNDGSVELLSAGQAPIFMYSRRNDTFNELRPQVIPLGLMPEIDPGDPAVLHLEAGDLLLLITDGFVEWRNQAGDEFGVERVLETIRRVSGVKPEEIIRELYRSVLVFANGTTQQDDLTAIVIKRAPVTEERTSHNEPSKEKPAVTLPSIGIAQGC
jgi:serine phosphatase RsbU (regulator of sigma subunit)